MSLNINANDLGNMTLQQRTRLQQAVPKQPGLSLSETGKEDKKDTADTLKLSREGQLRMQRRVDSQAKSAGVTSAREQWENDNAKQKNSSDSSVHVNEIDLFRLDDPEGYARMMELHQKAFESCHIKREMNFFIGKLELPEGYADEKQEPRSYLKDGEIVLESGKPKVTFHLDESDETQFKRTTYWERDNSEEAQKREREYMSAADKIYYEWRNDKCIINGKIQGSSGRTMSTVEKLEDRFSTDGHDLSVNFYVPGENDQPSSIYSGASLWRFSTKFNLLLSTGMIHTLTYGSQDERQSLMNRIDQSVQQMKEAEKESSGNHTYLRFGVKLYDDGRATFHANCKGCQDPYGISADNTDELLKQLMSIR